MYKLYIYIRNYIHKITVGNFPLRTWSSQSEDDQGVKKPFFNLPTSCTLNIFNIKNS